MARKKRDIHLLAAISRRFLAARRAISPTALALAEHYDIGQTTWSEWERGVSFPPAAILVLLWKDHGISADFLYSGDEGNLRVALRDRIRDELAKIPELSEADIAALHKNQKAVRTSGRGPRRKPRPGNPA